MVRAWELEAVLVDLDGVVLDYDQAERQAFAGVAMRVGLHDVATARQQYAAINRALWLRYEAGEVDVETLRLQRWAQLLADNGLDASGAARVSAQYLALLARSPAAMPGAVQAVRRVARMAPVVVLTNGFGTVARGRLAAAGLAATLPTVVASDEVGAPKPDSAMFAAGLAALGSPDAATVLMVGDNHAADIAGAADHGLRTAWIADEASAQPGTIRADLRAPSLAALVGRLWPVG